MSGGNMSLSSDIWPWPTQPGRRIHFCLILHVPLLLGTSRATKRGVTANLWALTHDDCAKQQWIGMNMIHCRDWLHAFVNICYLSPSQCPGVHAFVIIWRSFAHVLSPWLQQMPWRIFTPKRREAMGGKFLKLKLATSIWVYLPIENHRNAWWFSFLHGWRIRTGTLRCKLGSEMLRLLRSPWAQTVTGRSQLFCSYR